MRIAFLSEYYAPHIGGVEFRIRGLAHAFAAMGHAVTVFTIGYDPALPAIERDGDVQIERCPCGSYQQPKLGLPRNPFAMLAFALWCRGKAAANFDLCIYGEWPVLHALLAPARVRRRAVMDWCECRSGRVFGWIQALLPRRFRWNMATSDAVAARIHAASGRPVFTMPSGVDVAEFHAGAAKSGLLFLGRLARHKNLPLTIAAFESLSRGGYAGTLTIAGDGPEGASARALAAASPFADRIVMTGEVSAEQKIALLAGAELLLLLSAREGFPVTIAEAMASGVPTVTVNLPDNGGAQVVEQYQAGLVTRAQADAVAQAAVSILSDREVWSQRCLHNAAALDWNRVAEAMLAKVAP